MGPGQTEAAKTRPDGSIECAKFHYSENFNGIVDLEDANKSSSNRKFGFLIRSTVASSVFAKPLNESHGQAVLATKRQNETHGRGVRATSR